MSIADPMLRATLLHGRRGERTGVFLFLSLVFVCSAFRSALIQPISTPHSFRGASPLQTSKITAPSGLFLPRTLSRNGCHTSTPTLLPTASILSAAGPLNSKDDSSEDTPSPSRMPTFGPSAPPISMVSVLQTTQYISGLTRTQASTQSFQTALASTIASTLEVQAEAVSLGVMTISQYRRTLLSSVSISYSFSVSSSTSAAALTSMLDNAVTSGTFATMLSSNSGIAGLGVQGTFVGVTSTPYTAPAASYSTTTPAGAIAGAVVGAIAVSCLIGICWAIQLRRGSTRTEIGPKAPAPATAQFIPPAATIIILPTCPPARYDSPAYDPNGQHLSKNTGHVEGDRIVAASAWPV